MEDPGDAVGPAPAPGEHALTPQQVRFFETFGFLKLPGRFAAEIGEISAAFDEVVAEALAADSTPPDPASFGTDTAAYAAAFAELPKVISTDNVHFGNQRVIVPFILDRHPRLSALTTDPRITSVVEALVGPGAESMGSDGNVFDCDTSWHPDVYQAPLERLHVKLFFYLDHLDGDSGALRVMPGTQFWQSEYATRLRTDLYDWRDIEATFGVPPEEIPSWTITNEPGDLLVGSFRIMHATFHGAQGRRAFTMSYREPELAREPVGARS